MNIWFLACGLIFVAAACAAPQTQQNPNMEATIEASLFNSAVLKAQAQMEATIEASLFNSVAHKAQIELDKSIPKLTATSTLVPTSTSLPSPTSVPTTATPTQTPTPTPNPNPNPETIYLTGSGNHGLIEVDLTAGWRTAELTHTGTGYFLVAVLTGSAGTLATLADDVDYSQGTADFYTEEVGRYLIYVVATGDWSITISAPTAPTPTPTQAPTATLTPAPTQAPTATPTPLSRDSEYNNKKYGYGLILPAGWNYQETKVYATDDREGNEVKILPLVQAPETTIKTNPIRDSSLTIWAYPIPKGYFHIYELAENFSPVQTDFMENHSVISKSWMRSFLEGDKKGLFPGYEVLSSHEKTDSGKTLKYIRNTRW